VATLLGCQGLSPLTNKISVGEEPLVVMVGTGADEQVDLFAGSPGGGVVYRVTFTRDLEFSPAIHPDGAAVAFLRRAASSADSTTWLTVMNLVNAAERETAVPDGMGRPQRVGWSADGSRLYVSGEYGWAVSAAPPARMHLTVVPADDTAGVAAADSATNILLGSPAFARVEACSGSCIATMAQAMCVVAPSGERQELGGARWPVRWGADSLGYIEEGRVMVRSLGGGKPRVIAWTKLPKEPGMLAYWAPRRP
jgi:hypothetical protein